MTLRTTQIRMTLRTTTQAVATAGSLQYVSSHPANGGGSGAKVEVVARPQRYVGGC